MREGREHGLRRCRAAVARRAAADPRIADRHGIVVSQDVMVPMRDGVRLAFDVYRPGVGGAFAAGRFPAIMLHTPYDKATKRYTEIADYFVPRGYAVVLVDMRDRYRSEGSGTYFHSATPHTGNDGYDIVEWIAAQPWSERPRRHRRQLVRGPGADPHGARAATAPDRDLARRRDDEQLRQLHPRGRRDAGAHVLGALHPRPGRPGGAPRPGALGAGLGRPAGTSASSTGRRRGSAGRRRCGSSRRSSRR